MACKPFSWPNFPDISSWVGSLTPGSMTSSCRLPDVKITCCRVCGRAFRSSAKTSSMHWPPFGKPTIRSIQRCPYVPFSENLVEVDYGCFNDGSTLGPSRRSPPHGMLGLDPNVAPAASAEPPQKSSVICLEDPSDDRPKFSVTIGHFARQSTTIPAVRQPSTTFSLGEGSKKQFKKDQ